MAVCPWNKFAKASSEIQYEARGDLISPNLNDLVSLTDEEFRTKFSGSPIKRIGRNRFVRNVLYAIGNSRNKNSIQYIIELVSDEDYGVADAAKWALKKLMVNF